MKSRQEIMSEIEFESRKRNGRGCPADVTLTLTNKGKKVSLYFRNGVGEHFKEGLMFGILKNRIVLEPNGAIGYKISDSCTKRTDYGVVSATVSDGEKYRSWIGDYKLKWDEFYEFWYIEKEEG